MLRLELATDDIMLPSFSLLVLPILFFSLLSLGLCSDDKLTLLMTITEMESLTKRPLGCQIKTAKQWERARSREQDTDAVRSGINIFLSESLGEIFAPFFFLKCLTM